MRDFLPTRAALNGPTTCQAPGCGRPISPGLSRTQAKSYCNPACRDRAARVRAGQPASPARQVVKVTRTDRVPASYREPIQGWLLHLACGHTTSRLARDGRSAPEQVQCQDCTEAARG